MKITLLDQHNKKLFNCYTLLQLKFLKGNKKYTIKIFISFST